MNTKLLRLRQLARWRKDEVNAVVEVDDYRISRAWERHRPAEKDQPTCGWHATQSPMCDVAPLAWSGGIWNQWGPSHSRIHERDAQRRLRGSQKANWGHSDARDQPCRWQHQVGSVRQYEVCGDRQFWKLQRAMGTSRSFQASVFLDLCWNRFQCHERHRWRGTAQSPRRDWR